MDDGGTGLVVLLLADPHGLEGGEGGEDGSADPDGVLALGRGHDLDLDGGGGEGGDLLGHALGDAGEHGGAAGEDDVGVQVLADVDVALHDGLEGGVGDAVHLEAGEVGLEEDLGAAEALVADDDDVASGSSKDFSRAEDSAAFFISSSKSTATKQRDSLMSRTISRSAVVVRE